MYRYSFSLFIKSLTKPHCAISNNVWSFASVDAPWFVIGRIISRNLLSPRHTKKQNYICGCCTPFFSSHLSTFTDYTFGCDRPTDRPTQAEYIYGSSYGPSIPSHNKWNCVANVFHRSKQFCNLLKRLSILHANNARINQSYFCANLVWN